MGKKARFLSSAILLTFFLTFTPVISRDHSLYFIILVVLSSLVFTAFCLWDYLSGLEFITLLTLPAVFSLGMVSILFQFPNFSLFFRVFFYFIFFALFYTVLLSLNIFNVAAEKPIPLLRAAYFSSFVITIFSIFPILTLIYKSHLPLGLGLAAVCLLTFILSFQSVWTVFLPAPPDLSLVFKMSLIIAGLVAETGLVFSFFPMESFFRSLLLSTFFYIYLGFAHQYLRKNLNTRSVVEYSLVALVIVALVFLY